MSINSIRMKTEGSSIRVMEMKLERVVRAWGIHLR